MNQTLDTAPEKKTLDSETPTLETILGPCPECGMAPWFTAAERADILGNDAILAKADGLREVVRGMGRRMVCRRCSDTHEKMNAAQRHEHRIGVLRRRTFREGLMPDAARYITFGQSRADVEADNADAWAMFREFPLSRNLWVYGDRGRGKTFAARCILNAYLDGLRTAAEIGAHRIEELGRSYNAEQDMRQYCEVNVLLIDDVDKPAWTMSGVSAMWRIMDARCNSKLRTIITSNMTPDAVYTLMKNIKKMSDNPTVLGSLFDRMMRPARVEMVGSNLRREPGQEP